MYFYLALLLIILFRDLVWKLTFYLTYAIILPSVFLPYVVISRVLGVKTDAWRTVSRITLSFGHVKPILLGSKIIEKGVILTNHVDILDGGA